MTNFMAQNPNHFFSPSNQVIVNKKFEFDSLRITDESNSKLDNSVNETSIDLSQLSDPNINKIANEVKVNVQLQSSTVEKQNLVTGD